MVCSGVSKAGSQGLAAKGLGSDCRWGDSGNFFVSFLLFSFFLSFCLFCYFFVVVFLLYREVIAFIPLIETDRT